MKSRLFAELSALTIAITIACFGACTVSAAASTNGHALVTKVSGEATYTHAKSKDSTLKVGLKLPEGATISTSQGSSAELNLGVNGGILLVKPDSVLSIISLSYVSTMSNVVATTQLEVVKGGISGNVKKLAAESTYEIKTTNALAKVRGTTFTIYSDGTATVFSGSLVMTYSWSGYSSVSVTVQAGHSCAPSSTPGGTPLVLAFPRPDYPPPYPDEVEFPPPVIVVSPLTGKAK